MSDGGTWAVADMLDVVPVRLRQVPKVARALAAWWPSELVPTCEHAAGPVFVTAPVAELDRRLRERATESSGVIDDRLRKAREQLDEAEDFDFVVVNDDRERAARELEQIVADALDGAATMARQ